MNTHAFARPIVVVSKCLDLAACRYNGERIEVPFISMLGEHVDLRPVCPEVEIGLGTPRDPIRLVRVGKSTHLIQPSNDRDITREMRNFSTDYLGRAPEADGFILKGRSPSCGIKDTKVHGPNGNPLGKGAGMFAAAVLERFPRAAVEDEVRLTNARLRHHFLVKLFALAAFRGTRRQANMAALVHFHSRFKLQMMANNQAALRDAGRIVANATRLSVSAVTAAYEDQLARALARPARDRANINALQHAFGYVSKALSAREAQHFHSALENYRSERVPLSVPLSLVRSWIERFGERYLSAQTFFEPYPQGLMHRDSGRR